MNKDNFYEPIKIKNPAALELSDITVTIDMSGTSYRFCGIYNGDRALSAKLLKLMDNEKEFEKGADKTNDK